MLTIFYADGCRREGPGGGDGSEDITVHPIPLDAVDEWLGAAQASGKALDPKIYAALYWIHRKASLSRLFPGTSPAAD